MGSTRPDPVPPRLQTPRTARTSKAEAVVNGLMHCLDREVIRPEEYRNLERECYLVSVHLREAWIDLSVVVHQHLIGSDRRDMGVSLAQKIVMVFSNEIDTKLIRPGPTPEDRQSEDMWHEAWAMRETLVPLIEAVIAVDDKARGIQ